ncbi:MAG: hypothetical protein WA978_09200 [Sphingopyxis granuli]|uniref:hypothetical protein n=1 Tax=Sphingopyxis granuli TaxID=267128 RepID=UPI003C762B45
MKKILCGTVAALAIIGMASPAAARTNEKHYAGTGDVSAPAGVGPFGLPATYNGPYSFDNPQNQGPLSKFLIGNLEAVGELGITQEVGTRYTAKATAGDDSETATPTVKVEFAMTGTVNRDCSFYSGNDSGIVRNIDLGVIGVKTGNNENVNQAFEMTDDVEVNIETLTAGCNFNNRVEITKDDINGLVNNAPGAYDTDEFRANIPYTVEASWQGVSQAAPDTGSPQTLTVGDHVQTNFALQGAWRSKMNINIVATALNDKGLVAGTYEGTTTLTLSAS